MAFLIALLLICMVGHALVSGRVMAGSRGLQPNYYTRNENPFLYFFFLIFYAATALLIFLNYRPF